MLEQLKKLPLVRPAYHFLIAFLGAALYGFPSKRIFVIGVTGTKGKTTVLELMNAILEAAGPSTELGVKNKTALLSSITVKIGDHTEKNRTETTMPGRFFIQQFLRRAVKASCEYALIEVTSEGVEQHRHRFINWNAAFLINLHAEHIEAHGSFQAYRDQKLAFLKYAAKYGAQLFINRGDKNAGYFIQKLRFTSPVIYSREDLPQNIFGSPIYPMQFVVGTKMDETNFFMSDFNRDNAAAAVSLAKFLNIGRETIERALSNFKGVPGRMEFVQREPFAVVVDYAHTPDSLEAVYQAIRNSKFQIPNSKLICVLGSAGGGRDKWKRPVLGKIVAEYCDVVVLTNEDPYDEDPLSILNQIEAGFSEISNSKSQTPKKILDRKEAIRMAISVAKNGDTVVITGKGSEEWIHLKGGKKIPWSDRKATEELLRGKQKSPES